MFFLFFRLHSATQTSPFYAQNQSHLQQTVFFIPVSTYSESTAPYNSKLPCWIWIFYIKYKPFNTDVCSMLVCSVGIYFFFYQNNLRSFSLSLEFAKERRLPKQHCIIRRKIFLFRFFDILTRFYWSIREVNYDFIYYSFSKWKFRSTFCYLFWSSWI